MKEGINQSTSFMSHVYDSKVLQFQEEVSFKKGTKAGDDSKHKPKKPLTNRSHSNNEWKAMDNDERAEVRALREAKKPGTGQWTLGSVTSVTDKPPRMEAAPVKETNGNNRKGGNAGNQFECHAHMSEEPAKDPEVDQVEPPTRK
jgi:hypothetical protein